MAVTLSVLDLSQYLNSYWKSQTYFKNTYDLLQGTETEFSLRNFTLYKGEKRRSVLILMGRFDYFEIRKILKLTLFLGSENLLMTGVVIRTSLSINH